MVRERLVFWNERLKMYQRKRFRLGHGHTGGEKASASESELGRVNMSGHIGSELRRELLRQRVTEGVLTEILTIGGT